MKKSIYILSLIVLFASCKSSSVVTQTSSENKEENSNQIIDKIITTAEENIGIKYKAAGTTKSGYDCSGLVYSTFAMYDIDLPRSSYEQSKIGIELGQNLKKAKKGDLIFFKTNRKSQINHVGIVITVEDDNIKFIHSSTSRGVIISSTKEPYYQNTFVQLNRILK
ncbi:NlpC/P60 family protein [Flavobacterium gillisiae]|uniref:NlpC/P60 family protein n=1 Tax=Flavobacterium gillisiae TaxID=150146 RepID=A0A1H4CMS4_9FLAO|nr:C40 family peptidase [Flavobacterium gillisiae]SEA61618.1 NlpC/P60 family protein [Flavobacterium gillisiae]